MPKFEFNISAKGLSLLNALFLVEAADLVGGNLHQIQKQVQDNLGLPKYKFFDTKGSKDTQAFLSANDEIVVLSFRGTTSTRDWWTNLKIKLAPSIVGRVHQGFNEALDDIWEDVRKTLLDFRDRKQSIWVTGHSLGGALATVAADRLAEESLEVRGLYTFGQPRVGDKIFVLNFDNKMKQRSFRFVHDEDVVPKVPSFLQGYHHIGEECYFDRNGKLHTVNIRRHKFVSQCISIARRSSKELNRLRAQNPGGLRDHSLRYYKRYIRENLIKQKGGPQTFSEYINT
ncbi:MAG: lipase family protein [Omnitrophica bacterium]|nr:lipase family protein [Candidatus Omnitrophota bacterium]